MDIYKEIDDSPLLFVYFWAKECPKCVEAEPFVALLEKAYGDRMKFYKAGLEDAIKFSLDILPSFIIFKNGMVHVKVEGYKPHEVEKQLRACL